tara:strand:+ start:6652 stop:7902 length:1251 start_codon:yes stop_codon:yes gene_type:complete
MFDLSEEDGRYTEKIVMANHTFSTAMPKGVTIDDVHPDHLALIALLVAHPFVGKSLMIPWEVSARFAESCMKISKYKVEFDGAGFPEYRCAEKARPALAFSGGADSTASLLVMPDNTLAVFLNRPLKKKASMYNKSAALATVSFAKKSGYDVLSLECDVEYVREPLGFATDLVPSIPILALAASHNVDAVAFGTVMESAYRIGHEKAREYANSSHYRFWGRMFEAAGLPLYLPVSGVSEVGTSKIVMNSDFHPYSRSCIRGIWPQSCENCWKCFRKNMIEGKFEDGHVRESYLQRGLGISEVQRKMATFPVSHENVLAWALNGSTGPIGTMLNNRLEGKHRDLKFLEHFYPGAFDLMPEHYRQITRKKLEGYLTEMKEHHYPEITTHTMSPWLNSEEAKQAKRTYDEFIATQYQES